jgi:hypothetical protein
VPLHIQECTLGQPPKTGLKKHYKEWEKIMKPENKPLKPKDKKIMIAS